MHPHKNGWKVVLFSTALILIGAIALPSMSHAYMMAGAGGKLGYASPENLDGTMTVGGHLDFERADTRLHLQPNLMYWKVDRVSGLNPNMDVYYHFRGDQEASPYVGGGLGLNVRSSDVSDRSRTDLNANFIGGYRFPGQDHRYFVEGRYTASQVSQVAVVGGITFRTGH